MFTVCYSKTGDVCEGVTMYDQAKLSDVVVFFEAQGVDLTFELMSKLIRGERVEVQDMKVWVTEDVFAGTLI